MSDNYLRLIPIRPEYVPTPEQIDRAVAALSCALGEINARVAVEPSVQFVDPGSNLESITCPRCGAKVDFSWWGEAMGRASRDGFQNLCVEMLCCGQRVSLDDLDYVWPAGFARFLIEYRNPKTDISDDTLQVVSAALGIQLRKIWAHY